MTTKNDTYTYRVTWSEDDNAYVGLCAGFPSLSRLADRPEKALKGIRCTKLNPTLPSIGDRREIFVLNWNWAHP